MKSTFICITVFTLGVIIARAQNVQYRYDHSGRLSDANYSKKAVIFSYDKDGNRTGKINTFCNNPIANFSASQVGGNCPLTVDFINTSTTQGNITYEWTIYTDSSGTPSSYSQQNPKGVVFNYGGTFLVQLKVTDACGTNTKTLPGYITITCNTSPTSTQSIQERSSIKVYPNPTHKNVTVSGVHIPDGTYTLELSDVWGRVISKSQADAKAGNLTDEISLSSCASGTYFIKVSSGTTMQSFKITKE